MPAGSELNEGLGRAQRSCGGHATELGFERFGKSRGTERREGKAWALPVPGEILVVDVDRAVDLARRSCGEVVNWQRHHKVSVKLRKIDWC